LRVACPWWPVPCGGLRASGLPAAICPRLSARAQATRKGWPYYTRTHRRTCRIVVYSRATPCGWPAHGGLFPAVACALVACPRLSARAAQATRKRWPYYIRHNPRHANEWPRIVGPPLAGGLLGGWPVAPGWLAVAGWLVADWPTAAGRLVGWPADRGLLTLAAAPGTPMHLSRRCLFAQQSTQAGLPVVIFSAVRGLVLCRADNPLP
jgi:hypothetical protein